MRDVFVTMLAYRKFFPNCAWRAKKEGPQAFLQERAPPFQGR
jgi:hypothetical protein